MDSMHLHPGKYCQLFSLPSGRPQRSQPEEEGVLQGDRLLSSASAMEEPHQQRHPAEIAIAPGCSMAALPLRSIIRLMSLIGGDFDSAADLTMPDKVQSNSSSLAEDLVTSKSLTSPCL